MSMRPIRAQRNGMSKWPEAALPRTSPGTTSWSTRAEHTTYVSERNLKPDECHDPIEHPLRDYFFSAFENGRYLCKLN